MESNWVRADFKACGKLQGSAGELVRSSQELLGKELSLSLSAFLRCSVAVSYKRGEELSFADMQKDEHPCCVGMAMVRPDDHKLLAKMTYGVLYPLIGIALGAKAGSFNTPERKPTDIELQVVNLLFRLILPEAYRAWTPLLSSPLETALLEIDQRRQRAFQPADPVFTARFDVTVGEHTGQLCFVLPSGLFAKAIAADAFDGPEKAAGGRSPEAMLQLMLPATVGVDVWLDGSQMRLQDLLQLREGQIVKLDHPVERKAACTLNGKSGFVGQIVSTGARRAFLVDEISLLNS